MYTLHPILPGRLQFSTPHQSHHQINHILIHLFCAEVSVLGYYIIYYVIKTGTFRAISTTFNTTTLVFSLQTNGLQFLFSEFYLSLLFTLYSIRSPISILDFTTTNPHGYHFIDEDSTTISVLFESQLLRLFTHSSDRLFPSSVSLFDTLFHLSISFFGAVKCGGVPASGHVCP